MKLEDLILNTKFLRSREVDSSITSKDYPFSVLIFYYRLSKDILKVLKERHEVKKNFLKENLKTAKESPFKTRKGSKSRDPGNTSVNRSVYSRSHY